VKAIIQPGNISGTINAPTSKSSMQRACAAALLHNGTTTIHNPGKSNDDLAALDIIQKLGAKIIEQVDGSIHIEIVTNSPHLENGASSSINCGESGLSIRMFTPIAALSKNKITITGIGSLLKRPMDFFDEIFPQLGINITSNSGVLPVERKGPLQPKNITIDGSLSSQFLTGLLFAFAKVATKQVTITVTNLKSKPYIDLTLNVMQRFGYSIVNNNYESFTINPQLNINADNHTNNHVINKPINYTVEGDWSGGAFLLVAGAICGNVSITGLDANSTQADKAILQALIDCGANITIASNKIMFNSHLGVGGQAFHFNATDCPDLFPPLVALASYCNGTSVITGVNRLAHKESNRGLTLQDEFAKMGIEIILENDAMHVKGGTGVKGAIVHSRHDHRIAMACAVAALKANGETVIEEAEAVNKSYPNFYEDLIVLNASVKITDIVL
jgi:3-phosphoshikimate 1-carboxyvinyltransferase